MIADQNDSKLRNEIVTLRGGVCLVRQLPLIAKSRTKLKNKEITAETRGAENRENQDSGDGKAAAVEKLQGRGGLAVASFAVFLRNTGVAGNSFNLHMRVTCG
jgi:hypothetical protein